MTIVPKKKPDSRSSNKSGIVNSSSDEHQNDSQTQDHHRRSPRQCCSTSQQNVEVEVEDDYSGYNSGDEHTHERRSGGYMQWTEQDFQERELEFESTINKKGWFIKKMAEDGACLFRAVADQIYGDQEMHSVLRKLCIDYIVSITNTCTFGHY